MRVLFCASECAPYFKLGGLGDVAGSLPKALTGLGIEIAVAMPLFAGVRETVKKAGEKMTKKVEFVIYFGDPKKPEKVTVWESRLPDGKTPIFLFENKTYLGTYVSSKDFGDKDAIVRRFIFFSEAIVRFLSDYPVDLLHLNDWHVSLVADLLKIDNNLTRKPKTLLTIHNLSYKGRVLSDILEELPPEIYELSSVEWDIADGVLNCLKQGIVNADFISAVSPTYAAEIQTKQYGEGMEEIMLHRAGRIAGILNGLDEDYWNPVRDTYLKAAWESYKGPASWKAASKEVLQKEMKLPADKSQITVGLVTRLTNQKGVSLVDEAFRNLPATAKSKLQLFVLGSGDKKLEGMMAKLQKDYPKRVALKIGFDEGLAHRIYAGSDFFLVPSKFEPCGLTQMIAMRYGSVPIVRDTGGLHDSVTDNKTGLVFNNFKGRELAVKLLAAIRLYEEPEKFNGMRQADLAADFSWGKSARQYFALYEHIQNLT